MAGLNTMTFFPKNPVRERPPKASILEHYQLHYRMLVLKQFERRSAVGTAEPRYQPNLSVYVVLQFDLSLHQSIELIGYIVKH
jgi:hypothetical protein